MSKLAMMCGLPLSGKTTYSKGVLQSSGWVRVCPDEIRLALHGEQFIPTAEPFVWATAEVMVRALLRGGHDVVIDATNTTVERRKMWTRMAKEFGIIPYILWSVSSPTECHARNSMLGRLSPSTIDRMTNQFEPPAEDEGKVIRFGYNDNDQAELFD